MEEETDRGSMKTSAAGKSVARGAGNTRPMTDTQAIDAEIARAKITTRDGVSRMVDPRTVDSRTVDSGTFDAKKHDANARDVKSLAAASKPAVAMIPAARKRPVELKKRVVPRPEACGDVQLGFLSDFVGFHLRLAQDASYRTFAKHRDRDLIKPGRYPAMAIIHLNPGISQSALGRAIARDKSTVSPLIKDLQKNGFISRKASVHDRRSVTLSLTKKGERILDKLHVRAREHESELDRLVGASKGRLMVLLGKIIAGMAI